jgi:hypothetical protein
MIAPAVWCERLPAPDRPFGRERVEAVEENLDRLIASWHDAAADSPRRRRRCPDRFSV